MLKGIDAKARNHVELRFDGKGGLAYQVVGRYFVPWSEKPANEPLSIDVATTARGWRRTISPPRPRRSRTTCRKFANMVMVDLGIPPGFDLLSEDLQDYPGEDRRAEGRPAGEIQPDRDAGDSVLRLDRSAARR